MTAPQPPDHLVVQQSVFAGERFWAALNRLADRRGHGGHQRYLCGAREPTDRYALHCVTCRQVVATMLVQREPVAGDAAAGPPSARPAHPAGTAPKAAHTE